MKKLTFFLGIAIAIFVSANFAEAVQIIDDALQVNSLRVGQQGVGGVTYFNGTIINETTTDGVGNPVTFGDDVRIDGRLYRGATAGTSDSKPFIINDNLEVVGSLTIGSTNILSAINSKGTGDMLKSTYDAAANGKIDADKLDSGIAATLLASGTISNAEYGYLNGVTSNIQTQLNTKGVGDMLKSTYDVSGNSKIDAGKLDSGINATLIGGGGVSNTLFGYLANWNMDNTSNLRLTAIGYQAGNVIAATGYRNTLVGFQAGDIITTGDDNTAFGNNVLGATTTESNNTAFGAAALALNTADDNTAFGFNALTSNTTGTGNSAFGYGALDANNATGTRNTAMGHNALGANTNGVYNTAVGYNAIGNMNGSYNGNTAVGYFALDAVVTSNYNTAVGWEALTANSSGKQVTAIGGGALDANTTGDFNTAIGYGAMGLNTIGNNNTVLGYKAGDGISGDGNDNIIIGYDQDTIAGATDYYLNLGGILKGSLDPAAPRVDIDGAFTFIPSTDQTRANDSTITIDNGIVRVVGNGGAALLDTNPAIEDGAADGQIVIIQGTSDTNTVQIVDAANTALVGDAAITLGKGDNIQLMWDTDESVWYEISRANN